MPEDIFEPKTDESWETRMVRDWLRKPFKPEQIGKLPATPKRPALDFVGHAAVTDRLNRIAPDWSYTVDTMSELNGKVWIRGTMTIGGVSRPEFGDGDDPKEAIGNFIRRGAMRFGVAIDLWSREELEASPAGRHGLGDPPRPAGDSASPAAGPADTTKAAGVATTEPPSLQAPQAGGTTSPVSFGEGDQAATTGPGEAKREDDIASPGSTKDAPGPPHYPLNPAECSHKNERTGHLLRPRKSPRGPVCPRCGLSYIAIVEGAA